MELDELFKICSTLDLLYVEDDKEAMEATLELFEDLFKSVTFAFNGQEGYELFQKNDYDIIITDLAMPILDGLEMSKKIKAIEDIPIIILSAYKDIDFFLDSIETGVDGYLFKPINIKDFSKIIIKVIKKRKIEEEKKALEQKLKNEETTTLKKRIKIQELTQKNQTQLLKELAESKQELEAIYKHIYESIEYASLIQGAIVSKDAQIAPYFKDSFVHWLPKDTVGGDIWLFENLRHEDECLLMYIDCTGHGVAGAFVTMIVKAIEREIVSTINSDPNRDVSPAWIMSYFNRTIKKLLGQESKDSISNAGFDGGIIYYNRRKQILKFCGAETPLFYIMPNGEQYTIKGNRYSVGYKKCDANYQYKETIINVEEGMKFFCTTDGYLDQNGGDKDFPFGKKRFVNIIKNHYEENMCTLKHIFIQSLEEWENAIENNDRNDDITVIGFEIGKGSTFLETTIEEIVKFEGVITQNTIASFMDSIEYNIKNIGIRGLVSTIVIEYCQNIMNYAKSEKANSYEIIPVGFIEVQYVDETYYEISASNIVSKSDKDKLEPKLQEIKKLDKDGIKKRYKELRKLGTNTHSHGGGIGIYEIAKASDIVNYNFELLTGTKYIFTMKSIVYNVSHTIEK